MPTEPELNATIRAETMRIRTEYARRAREIPADFYAYYRRRNLFAYQERERAVLRLLESAGLLPFGERRILDVGCGYGHWLADMERWSASRASLHGIDLDPERLRVARRRLGQVVDADTSIHPGADLRVGDATALPWADATFDVVLQATLFTSVLDATVRTLIAKEMSRVLCPGGHVLWYDFVVNNPRNAGVRGIPASELHGLFPGFCVKFTRTTLAPPLSRRIVPISWLAAELLSRVPLLNTHCVALLTKPTRQHADP